MTQLTDKSKPTLIENQRLDIQSAFCICYFSDLRRLPVQIVEGAACIVIIMGILLRTEENVWRQPMNWVMKYGLVLCLLWASGSALAGADEIGFGECPLNVTEMNSHPWLIQQCLGRPDVAHCCEAVQDLVKILLFSWLGSSRNFVLPSNRTSAVCLDAFQRHLRAQGISREVLGECKLRPDSFVSDSASCLGIDSIASFERAVNATGMKQYCNVSSVDCFQCNLCVRAMALALNQLQNEGGSGRKSSCPLLVLMYVAGGINCYDALGPDAAYCLMSAQNLPSLAASIGGARPGKRNTRWPIKTDLWIIIPTVTVVLLLSLSGFFNRRKLRSALGRSTGTKLNIERYEVLSESSGLIFFSLSEIMDSTGNFSASNVIGEGGFSTVYKGTLPGGSLIAVKRFRKSNSKGDAADLRHEVQVISKIRHRNLLPLRGYCIGSNDEGLREHLLVYDFMENGSLADYLFRSNGRCLTWDERYKIAVGIARGLAYLHQDAKPAIIHRDVKAANVLLDAKLNPLVADFGLAKFKQDTDKTHYTTRAVGTLGYVAPEYALYGHLTDKTDVFGFGVILLELVTGRKALDSSCGVVEHLLVSDWVCDLMQKGRAEEVIDERIRDSGPKDIMERVIRLALQCTHPKVICRPSIPQALLMLEVTDRPLPDTGSTSTSETQSETYPSSRGDLTWMISPRTESRSVTLDSMSRCSSSTEINNFYGD